MQTEANNRPKTSNRFGPSWLVPVAVLTLAAILIGMVVVTNWGGDAAKEGTSISAGSTPPIAGPQGAKLPPRFVGEARDPKDLLAVGPVNAPVVLVLFSDYQCSFCARWSAQTLPAMMQHVKAGKLRIEWRDVNIFGANSERAARAVYAAAQQGAFLQYHDALFKDGKRRSEAELSNESLIALAGKLGLKTDKFATSLASKETAAVIAANQKLGLDLGVASTPSFIMGGKPIVGAQPTEVFQTAFQAALKRAQ